MLYRVGMGNIENDIEDKGGDPQLQSQPQLGGVVAIGKDDDAIIPKGQIDPVYDAKARVLNHAARCRLRKPRVLGSRHS